MSINRIAARHVLLALGAGSLAVAFAQAPNVAADTYIQSGTAAAQNFGGLANMLVGLATGTTQNKGLVQFDLSGLSGLTGADVQKATVWFYLNRVTTGGSVDVYDLASSWSESAATWNAAPSAGVLLGAIATTSPSQWVGLDITNEVRGWLTTAANNHGLMLAANTVNNTTAVQFDTKENTTTSHPAQLQIVLGGPAGATGPAGPTGASGPSGPAGVGASGPSGPAGSITVEYAFVNKHIQTVNGGATFKFDVQTASGITLSGSDTLTVTAGGKYVVTYSASCLDCDISTASVDINLGITTSGLAFSDASYKTVQVIGRFFPGSTLQVRNFSGTKIFENANLTIVRIAD